MNWVGGSRTRVSVADRNQKNFKASHRFKISELRTPIPSRSSRMGDRKVSSSYTGNFSENRKSGHLSASAPKSGVDVFNLLLANISTENLSSSSKCVKSNSEGFDGVDDKRSASATRKRRVSSASGGFKHVDLFKTPLAKRNNGFDVFGSSAERQHKVAIHRFETPFTLSNNVASLYAGEKRKNSSDDSLDKLSPKLNPIGSRSSTPHPRISTKVPADISTVRNNWDVDQKIDECEDGELSDESRDITKQFNHAHPVTRSASPIDFNCDSVYFKHPNDDLPPENDGSWDKDDSHDISGRDLYQGGDILVNNPETNWNANATLIANPPTTNFATIDFPTETPIKESGKINHVGSPSSWKTPLMSNAIRSECQSVPNTLLKTPKEEQDLPRFDARVFNDDEDNLSKTRRDVIDMVHEMVDRIGARRVYKMLSPIHAEILL